MPRDDRRPEKADDGWFIDFDDEDALDITALTAARRQPAGQNRPPRRPPLRSTASAPEPEVGDHPDAAQGDTPPPEASELPAKVGSAPAERDATVPGPARQVARASTQVAPASDDVDPGRTGLEVDQTRQADRNPAAAGPGRELHAPTSEAGAGQRGERTAAGGVRRHIAGASLLAACLVGGVLLPFGPRSARPPTGVGTGQTQINEALAEPASPKRSALRTQWQDPPTVAMPLERATEAVAVAPGETVGTRKTILISAVLAPPNAGEEQHVMDTASTLPSGDVTPIPLSDEERTLAPSMTVVARLAPAADGKASDVAASAKSLCTAHRHTGPAERAKRIEPDERGRSPNTVDVVRSSQRTPSVPQYLTRNVKPAAPAVRASTVRVAPTQRQANAVAHRPSPAITSQVTSRQVAVGDFIHLDHKRSVSSKGQQVPRAEQPRTLVLPTSLQPTPF